ncbi:F0F1 ATP synthase subunit B [bacterium]|nr:F0F1 ATP synthase subunit B [bacterium]
MLGFDFSKTIFLVANFFILLFLMKKFFFKPIMEILEARKDKIEEGLKQRAIAKEEQEQALRDREEIIAKSKSDAQKILNQTEQMKKDIIANAKSEADKILKDAKAEIAKEREELRQEMNLKLIELVSSAAYTALPDLAKQDGHKDLVESVILDSLKRVAQ